MNEVTEHKCGQVAKAAQGEQVSLLEEFGKRYGMKPSVVFGTLQQTAFRQSSGATVTDDQMMALLVVANQYDLNPFTKELYAFPDKGKIIPVVSIDGWLRIINSHPQFDGMEFEAGEFMQIDEHAKPCPDSLTCIIHRKDRGHPIRVTEYLDEVYRKPYIKNNQASIGPWQSHTKRFLRHKAIIQSARIAFGFAGIYDQDEAERIVEASPVQQEKVINNAEEIAAGYPDDQFEDNFPKWEAAIKSGKRSGQQIIAMVSTKAALSAEQIAKIEGVTK